MASPDSLKPAQPEPLAHRLVDGMVEIALCIAAQSVNVNGNFQAAAVHSPDDVYLVRLSRHPGRLHAPARQRLL